MTTKTTIISSPIRRCYTSPKLKKHRILKYRTIPSERINRSIEETISRIAMVLRNVGDQLDEQIRIDHLSSNDFVGQQTERFLRYFSAVLRLFL